MEQPKRRLKIDMVELAGAFEHHDPSMEISCHLDIETGKVIMLSADDHMLWALVEKSCRDPQTGEIDWPKAAAEHDIDDWQKENLEVLIAVEQGPVGRYLPIPQEESHDGFGDLEAFIETVSNPYLHVRLEKAIQERGPFRHFKEALQTYPIERRRWFDFQEERRKERILNWLDAEGIEPIEGDAETEDE